MGSYSGNIAYCIEPGTGQRTGDTLTEKDENFFNNISPNGTISGDDIRLLIGRILQYGYRGGISTSWKSQNESDANCIAHAYATQILIWETIVGERDASFNHVSTGGYNAVLECVSSAHPLRSKILSYYNSMVMHEGSHQIFKMLFPHDYGVTQKSAGVHYCKANSERNKPISDWEEWQANTLGAAILLPENLIKQGMYLFSLGEKIECLNKIYYPSVYKRFDALADFLGCSKKALAIRMKQLGLLKKEYLDNPFDLVTVYPEVSEL